MKYYFCIDIGGTDIKGGVIDQNYKVLYQDKMKTSSIKQHGTLGKTLKFFIECMAEKSNYSTKCMSGIGIGCPGLIDGSSGTIKYSACLNLSNYPLTKELKKYFNVPVKLANDAELACLAEKNIGAAKKYSTFVMLTLGTGIGSGIVINGKSVRESSPFACEIGHNLVAGSKKTFEQLASTKALVEQTKQAMKENQNSKLWKTYKPETVDGQAVFEYKNIDSTAKRVFDNFIETLGLGIVNICNTLCPQVIVIGGAISAQGSALIEPLEDYVNSKIFTKNIINKIKIVPAKFQNGAGILGARCLFE